MAILGRLAGMHGFVAAYGLPVVEVQAILAAYAGDGMTTAEEGS